MIRRMLNDESGYSLVEVIVSIMLLSIAIIPMVGMFDAGLRAATTGSNYDRARTLANSSMENIKALPYEGVQSRFAPGAEDSCPVTMTEFSCDVTTEYLNADLTSSGDPTSQMKVVVQTGWGGDADRITITGLVSRSQP